MSRLRVIAGLCALAVVAVLVLVLSSGGGGGGNFVSGSALADAARATERVPGASISMEMTVGSSLLPQPVRVRMHGVQNTKQRAVDFVGEYENFPKKVPGERADGSIPFEGILVLPHMYMRSPLFSAGLPSGKSWMHVDIARVTQAQGLGDPQQFESQDPTQNLESLRTVSSRVERLGSEDVRGVATTHYRGTVELRRLPEVSAPSKRAAARRTVARLIKLTGEDSYPMEVWVDKHRLVRRMRVALKMKVQGQAVTEDMTMDMYDFGPKQKIKPPPAGDVYDATKLASKASPGGP